MNTNHKPAWCEGAKAITRVTTKQWYIVFSLSDPRSNLRKSKLRSVTVELRSLKRDPERHL